MPQIRDKKEADSFEELIDVVQDNIYCKACDGTGESHEQLCKSCGGTGRIDIGF